MNPLEDRSKSATALGDTSPPPLASLNYFTEALSSIDVWRVANPITK